MSMYYVCEISCDVEVSCNLSLLKYPFESMNFCLHVRLLERFDIHKTYTKL